MDIPVDEFIDGLLKEGTVEIPPDTKKPNSDDAHLPPWFDEKKFNQGRRFFFRNCFGFGVGTFCGLLAVFAIPTILNVLVCTYHSNSVYTAYKRYMSTYLHSIAWFRYEMKPGSVSWKSLTTVRSRHFRASITSKNKKIGIISQRDISLTLYGFFGYAFLNPDRLGIVTADPGDWEGFIHVWRTVGYMIGLEDKYNICRKNVDETRQVFRIIQDRIFTPALENVPEHWEHMTRVMLDGMWNVNPISDTSVIFFAKYLAEVPGYILNESQRIAFSKKLMEINRARGMPLDTPVESTILLPKAPIEGLPTHLPPRIYDPKDYATLAAIPTYRDLSWYEKIKVNVVSTMFYFANMTYSRWFLNLYFRWVIWQMEYFPYYSFIKYGIKKAFVDMFKDSSADDIYPMNNEEFYKSRAKLPWYRKMFYGLIDSGL